MRKQEVLRILNDVLESSKMNHACFGQLIDKGPFPQTESEVTGFIKERTRIYRQSWIISPLEEAIALIEKS